jgi:hypothetical protein
LDLESRWRDRVNRIDDLLDNNTVGTLVAGPFVLSAAGDHRSIPFVSGCHRSTASAKREAISFNMRLPSTAEAAIGSPRIPLSLTAATPPERIDAINSDTGATLPLIIASVRTAVGEM